MNAMLDDSPYILRTIVISETMSIIISDAQSEKSLEFKPLDLVGMSHVETFIRVGIDSEFVTVPAILKFGVNLAEGFRGIHMSRLFQLQMDLILNQVLSTQVVQDFLSQSILSQNGLSTKAFADFDFQLPVVTQSLKSKLSGSRIYPILLKSVLQKNEMKMQLQFQILYSSTCPQSVKLSKEFLNQKYDSVSIQEWLKEGNQFPATPHAQRSLMTVKIQSSQFSKSIDLIALRFIQLVEATLKTPVQTAVKKSDEMEFARLNGENPMFCEDAVRLVAEALHSDSEVEGFKVTTEHQESLHSHNAIAEISSNFTGL
jgi:GTP cyclohydrolase IB